MSRLKKLEPKTSTKISELRYRITSEYFEEAIRYANASEMNGAKCTAHYRFGLYLDEHYRNTAPQWKNSLIALSDICRTSNTISKEKVERVGAAREMVQKERSSGISLVPMAIRNFKDSILSGNVHAEDSLFKIINIVFDAADTVRDTISLCGELLIEQIRH